VTHERRVVSPRDVVVHRSRHVGVRAVAGSPPRIRYDEAVLDVVTRARTADDAAAELGRVVQGRRTTATRLLETLAGRERIPQRPLLEDVLSDVASGAWSSLERAYLVDVERAHGLPTALRQSREPTELGIVSRDAVYVVGGRRLVLELDGRPFHDTARQRNADYDRDLGVRVAGDETVRLSWSQVRGHPCWTAVAIGRILTRMGWSGAVRACGAGCRAAGSPRTA
jgi:hypothetical protein